MWIALLLAAAPVAPPAPAAVAPRAVVIVVDDRAVKDQAPAPMIASAIAEIDKRRGVSVVRMSSARSKLDARADQALAHCVDQPGVGEAGCLAAAARDMGGDVVLTLRLTRREGAYFLALTSVNALRPQMSDDRATLAGDDAAALAFIPEAVSELFPGELKATASEADSHSTGETK